MFGVLVVAVARRTHRLPARVLRHARRPLDRGRLRAAAVRRGRARRVLARRRGRARRARGRAPRARRRTRPRCATRRRALDARHAEELAALRARHADNRAQRRDERARARPRRAPPRPHALDQASRADTAERRRLIAAHAEARAAIAAALATLDERASRSRARRADRSRELWQAIHDTYVAHQRARRRADRSASCSRPIVPPGGAGDCAAPKLLGARASLGPAPARARRAVVGRAAVDRRPPRRRVLSGVPRQVRPDPAAHARRLAVDAARRCSATRRSPPIEPRTVFEDRVAGRRRQAVRPAVGARPPAAALRDSVLTRLRARYPDATGPMLVHRLDLDTSGLLLAAKDPDDPRARSSSAFARREIDKRYVALARRRASRGDAGTIDLALRVDLDDRPRQIHDPIHGKPAITEWRVARAHRRPHARRAVPAHRPHPPAPRPRRPPRGLGAADRRRSPVRPRRRSPAAARRGARLRPPAHRRAHRARRGRAVLTVRPFTRRRAPRSASAYFAAIGLRRSFIVGVSSSPPGSHSSASSA